MKTFIYLLSIGFIILSYSGCGGFEALDSSDGLSLSAEAFSTSKLDGEALYIEHCASCHLPLAQTTKRFYSWQKIKDAIKGEPGVFVSDMNEMSSLLALTDAELMSIGEALKKPPEELGGNPDSPIDEENPKSTVNFQQPLGNRLFIASKMKSLFARNDTTINQKIDSLSTDLAPVFSGPCNRLVPECRREEDQNLTVPGIATSNVLRSGYRIRLCETVLEYDATVSNLLTQLGLTTNSTRSEINVSRVFEAMTTLPVNEAVYNDFAQMDQKIESNLESWRMIMLPICKSNLFENF